MRPIILSIFVTSILTAASPTVAQPPSHLWSHGFGDTGIDNGVSVVTDNAGNVFMTGYFWWTVDFGGGGLESAGQRDIVLAKYNPTGGHLWSKSFGVEGVEEPYSVAADDSGNVILAGRFQDTVDFGGGDLVSTGFHDAFVAKFSPTGTHLWSHRFGGTGATAARSVAVDDSGNVFVAGTFDEFVDFGGGNLYSDGDYDIFLAKYSPSGTHIWSQSRGGTESDGVSEIAMDPSGSVFMAGNFSGSAYFGGGALTSNGLSPDIVLAKYSPSGAHIWSQHFGSMTYGTTYAYSIAADDSGNVLMGATFTETVNFGGGNLTSAGVLADIVLAKYDPGGSHLWSQQFGNAAFGQSFVRSVAADDSGNVFMTGAFSDSVDFGGGPLVSDGVQTDIVVAKYNPAGTHLWSERFGDVSAQTGTSVAIDTSSNVLVLGNFAGTVDFGGGNVVSAGNEDIFLAKFGLDTATGVRVTPRSPLLSVRNFPNPFNPSTIIRYTLPSRGNVTVAIFDTRGARVATLIDNESVNAGAHQTTWAGRSDRGTVVPSGVYFARIEFNGTAHTRKMVLLK